MTEPKFTIPPENFNSFVITALADINAKLLVLSDITMQFYSTKFEMTKEETRKHFDELLASATVESIARYYLMADKSKK